MHASLEELDISHLSENLITQINTWCEGVPGWRPIVAMEILRRHEGKLDHFRRLILAKDFDRPIGACLISSNLTDRISELDFLVVAPEVRRNGLGRRLLVRAEAIAAMHCSCKVRALVGVENLPGESLLRTLGYHPAWYDFRMVCALERATPLSLPEGYRVRLFRGGDEPHLLRVINDAFRDIDPHWQDWGDERLRREFFERMGLRWISIFLAEHNGQVVGTATAWCDTDGKSGQLRGWLQWLAVMPSHRRRGLGRALVISVLNRLLEEGLAEAYLNTNTRLQPALALYRSLGFREIERWAILQKMLPYG